MAKKPDLSGIKNFFFNKGERVGLGVCAAVAVLLISLGLLNASKSVGTPYHKQIEAATQQLQAKIQSGDGADTKAAEAQQPNIDWPVSVALYKPNAFTAKIEDPDTKRLNPMVLAFDPRKFQIDYVQGGQLHHQLIGASVRGFPAGAYTSPIPYLKARRMVVVYAAFPMADQINEFFAALRLKRGEMTKDLMPHPIGLDVHRGEVVGGKEPTTWTPLYVYDAAKDRFNMTLELTNFFKEMVVDVKSAQDLGPFLYSEPGMLAALPRLETGKYPPVKIEGLDLPMTPPMVVADPLMAGNPAAAPPAPAAPAAVQGKGNPVNGKPPPELVDKYLGNVNVFDPTLRLVMKSPDGKKTPVTSSGIAPPIVLQPTYGGGDAIARFVDVDVQPGKTYKYKFLLHMANPNFGNKKDVSYPALAEVKELPLTKDHWVTSPTITIPDDFFYYVADQPPEREVKFGATRDMAKADEVPFQLHRWKDSIEDQGRTFNLADWAILERILVRKGEPIGPKRFKVNNQEIDGYMVEMPSWKAEDVPPTWKTEHSPRWDKKFITTKGSVKYAGIPIDFAIESPPILVDFEGGKTAFERSAIQALILAPDGRLVVRNSRDDVDPDNAEAKERQDRVENWRTNVNRYQ